MELKDPRPGDEQRLYAGCLDWGTRIGFVALFAAFLAYTLQLAAPHVPLEDLPRVWTLSVARYLAATGAPTGWGWLRLVAKSDYMNFVGIALLALVTIACYLRILPALLRRGERFYALLAAAQLIVLLGAALY